jgi:hypothetical protein
VAGSRSARVLILALACAGPILCRISGLVADDLFLFPRNMSASLPFVGLALGWVLVRPARPWAVAAVVVAAVGLGLGAAQTLRAKAHRPDFPGLARLLDERMRPRDVVLYYGPALDPFVIGRTASLYYARSHRVAGTNPGEASVWHAFDRRRGQGRIFLAQLEARGGPRPPSVAGWEAVDHRDLPGLRALTLVTYEELRPRGRALVGGTLRRTRHAAIPLIAGRLRGVVDASTKSPHAVTLVGWASTADGTPVKSVLAFVGDRVAAAGVPFLKRPDVSEDAPRDLGFTLSLAPDLVRDPHAPVRVIASTATTATPLPFGCAGAGRQVVGC